MLLKHSIIFIKKLKRFCLNKNDAQKVLEEILFDVLKLAFEKSGEKKFLFSGGVAMNSAAARKCTKLSFMEELNIPPSPGDSGAAIGAAYYGYLKNKKS